MNPRRPAAGTEVAVPRRKYERELGYNWLPLIFKGQNMINIYVVLLNSIVFLMKRKTECLFMKNVQIV
ncbi:hypothetical protein llap_748 [Limosa lapponica baueri]|uniref:Uncharacterized protein n=1 Tax=Limosa lapponica baueri TaxID=1758121 RepID=A0A2I0US75_LIMLA|nr:hypothetical protein llap_748 [Limosa lapponica baueri]